MACGCQNKNNENQNETPVSEEKGLVKNIKDKIEEVKRLWKESDEKSEK